MTALLGWGVRRLGLQSILSVVLLATALSSIALGLTSIIRGLDTLLVLTIVTGAMLVGWTLARLRWPGWLASISALIMGVGFVILRVGQLGGELLLVMRAWVELAWQSSLSGLRPPPDAQPALQILARFAADVNLLAVRTRDWLLAMKGGTPVFDPVAVAIVWSLALWLAAVWATWWVDRRDQPCEGLIPGMALLGGTLAAVGGNPAYLLALSSALLLLMLLSSTSGRERRWNRTGMDYAEDIRFDLVAVSVPLAVLLITLASVTPSLSISQIARSIQKSFVEPAGESAKLSNSLGLIPQPGPESPLDAVRTPGLPRQHLIGSGPELSREEVLSVRVDDPQPGDSPHYYWRSNTYDVYTGRGWLTGETTMVDYQAGEQTISQILPSQRLVRQDIQIVGDAGGLLYSAGTPVTADHDYAVAWRSENDADLFGAQIQANSYRVESLVSAESEAALRLDGGNYPAWASARYLQLPEGIPDRVYALARDLTATAPTPYDRARAIETYLRTFPYTLDLPEPPSDREIADYFLFDLRRGYCDYYATSMVVLARAAGLPARLVVGYAMGKYDQTRGRYVVTKADAHSWAEVFFPMNGWVEFEPTGGREAISRPDQNAFRAMQEHRNEPAPASNAPLDSRANWWLALPGGIALLGLVPLFWLTLSDVRLRRMEPDSAIRAVYGRLCRSSRRLRMPTRSSDTPNEIANQCAEKLAALGNGNFGPTGWEQASQDIRWLTGVYVQSCYGRRRSDAATQMQAIQTWQRLRSALWRAWVMNSIPARFRRLTRKSHNTSQRDSRINQR